MIAPKKNKQWVLHPSFIKPVYASYIHGKYHEKTNLIFFLKGKRLKKRNSLPVFLMISLLIFMKSDSYAVPFSTSRHCSI